MKTAFHRRPVEILKHYYVRKHKNGQIFPVNVTTDLLVWCFQDFEFCDSNRFGCLIWRRTTVFVKRHWIVYRFCPLSKYSITWKGSAPFFCYTVVLALSGDSPSWWRQLNVVGKWYVGAYVIIHRVQFDPSNYLLVYANVLINSLWADLRLTFILQTFETCLYYSPSLVSCRRFLREWEPVIMAYLIVRVIYLHIACVISQRSAHSSWFKPLPQHLLETLSPGGLILSTDETAQLGCFQPSKRPLPPSSVIC